MSKNDVNGCADVMAGHSEYSKSEFRLEEDKPSHLAQAFDLFENEKFCEFFVRLFSLKRSETLLQNYSRQSKYLILTDYYYACLSSFFRLPKSSCEIGSYNVMRFALHLIYRCTKFFALSFLVM